MATYESHSTLDATFSGVPATFNVTKPSGLAEGDLMIAFIMIGGTESLTSSDGFTKISDVNDASNASLEIYAKIATSGDVAETEFTWSGTGDEASDTVCIGLIRISGTFADVTSNISVISEYETTTATPVYTGSVTPTALTSLYLMGIGIRINNFSIGSQAIANNNPTWTERFEIFENDNNDSRLAVATATPTSVSSSGNYSAVISSAAESFGALVVVNDSVSDSISIDAPGILTLSGNSHTLNYGRQIPIDAPGVLTLSTPEPTTDTQENELWVNDTKPSNTWTNQTK